MKAKYPKTIKNKQIIGKTFGIWKVDKYGLETVKGEPWYFIGLRNILDPYAYDWSRTGYTIFDHMGEKNWVDMHDLEQAISCVVTYHNA